MIERTAPVVTGHHKPFELDLSETGLFRVPFGGVLWVVDEFDGASDTVYLQTHQSPDIGGYEEIALYAWNKYPTDQQFWIRNTTAQSGKKLKLRIGLQGASIGPGQKEGAYGSATEETLLEISNALANQAVVVTGQKAVPNGAAVAVGTQAIPDGFNVLLIADEDNTVPVWIGPSGVDDSSGAPLYASAGLTLRVSNLSAVYCKATTTGQKVYWILVAAS